MKRTALVLLSFLCIGGSATADTTGVAAAATAGKPALGTWGLDLANMDRAVAPGDDFYRYVNGGWLATNHIPDDRASWGASAELRRLSETRVEEIIEGLAGKQDVDAESRKIRDLYASFVDEATIEKLGLAPARADLERLGSASSYEAVAGALGDPRLQLASPFNFYIDVDAQDPNRYAVAITQGGLGLPDRDYYLRDDEQFPGIRKEYVAAIERMLSLANVTDAASKAQEILALERRMAEVHWPVEAQRDAEKTYNPTNRAGLQALAPAFPWRAFRDAAYLGKHDHYIANEKDAFPKLAEVFRSTPLATWQAYLQFHYLHGFAPYLTNAMDDANFAFFGTVLANQPAQLPRATRGVRLVSAQLGEAVGRVYVERFFPAESKAQMEALVANLRAAFAERIDTLDWMSKETKAAARRKLALFNVKIGYPDEWIEYAALDIEPDDLLGNVQRATDFDWRRRVAKLPGPVDRKEWGLTPQTVNAYYSSGLNEIVFPAAILQPPFFDPHADAAVNYGGIGAVIGHEIGHGFDDQGSKYDGKGVLRSWWTPEDRARFDERTGRLVAQYETFEPLPALHVNGALTLGENIGDLGGMQMAYAAYRRSLGGREAPAIDGFTGDQRFFMSWAQVWRAQYRDGVMRELVLSNPHSPPQYRVNGVVSNIDAWYAAFGIPADARMGLAPAERVAIW